MSTLMARTRGPHMSRLTSTGGGRMSVDRRLAATARVRGTPVSTHGRQPHANTCAPHPSAHAQASLRPEREIRGLGFRVSGFGFRVSVSVEG